MNLTYEQRAKLDRLRIGLEANQWGKDELVNMRSQFAARKSAFNDLRIEMVEKALAGSKPEIPATDPEPVPDTNID